MNSLLITTLLRLTKMSVDQPQKSQSMDMWIGISVSFAKITKTGLCSGLWGQSVRI